MSGIGLYKHYWRAAVFAGLLFVGDISLAIAGQDEDFAAGMISYRRSDFATAMPHLRKAADAGHAEAQAVLAAILDATDADEEAVTYYRKAAEAGNLDGVFGLATMYASGDGIKKDIQQARSLLIRAAEGGHKEATWLLAQAYIRGELGFSEDQRNGPEALKWIALAADQDFIVAIDAMEKAYRSGGYGLAVDMAKADQLKQRIQKITGVKEKKIRKRGEPK
jgi:TPR repeat protein